MDTKLLALIVYCAVQWLNVTGLLTDVMLTANGLPSISDFCTRHWLAGALIVLVNCIPPIALAMHFWGEINAGTGHFDTN